MPSISELAPRLAGLAWVSRSLFEIEGMWAESISDARATIHLATNSRHHGWHATLWSDALPDSPALEAGIRVTAPSPGWSRSIEDLDAVVGTDDTSRLAALYRVLVPRCAIELRELERIIGGPGDAHIARIVGLVSADVTADLIGGLALLTATLSEPDAIDRAADTARVLDQAFQN